MKRRSLLAIGGATVLAGLVPALPAAALPAVNMEMVLLAAQVDPPKTGTGITTGAGPSVLEVERALQAKGLLAASAVDGHFGTSTISAYASWQRSLGYSGLDANGLPGATSLARLGDGRFSLSRPVSSGTRTSSYGGKQVNARTRDMLAAADSQVTWSLNLDQGSYTTEDPTSAGTHDGGGTVDLAVGSLTTTQRWETVRALRTVGFAAWLRTPSQGSWPYHIHAVAVLDPDLSAPAANQVHDYYVGDNGLADHAADDTPTAYRTAFTWWEAYGRG